MHTKTTEGMEDTARTMTGSQHHAYKDYRRHGGYSPHNDRLSTPCIQRLQMGLHTKTTDGMKDTARTMTGSQHHAYKDYRRRGGYSPHNDRLSTPCIQRLQTAWRIQPRTMTGSQHHAYKDYRRRGGYSPHNDRLSTPCIQRLQTAWRIQPAQ